MLTSLIVVHTSLLFQAETNSLRREVAELTARLAVASQSNASQGLEEELASSQRRVSELEAAIAASDERAVAAEDALRVAQADAAKLRHDLEESKAKYETLRKETTIASEQAAEEMAGLRRELADTQRELESARASSKVSMMPS